MSFLLDLLCAALMVLVVLALVKRPVSAALLTTLCFAAALTAGFFLSKPLSKYAADYVMAPIVEKQVGNDLADMFSAPHQDTGKETVKDLSFDWMLENRPTPFVNLVDKYGADMEAVAAAYYRQNAAVDLLTAVTAGYCEALSHGLVFLVLFLLCFALFRFITKRIENNLPPPHKMHTPQRLISLLLGCVCAVMVIFAVGILLETVVPYLEYDSVIFSVESLRSSFIYKYLNLINPFVQLLL